MTFDEWFIWRFPEYSTRTRPLEPFYSIAYETFEATVRGTIKEDDETIRERD